MILYHDIHQYLGYDNTEWDIIIDTKIYKYNNHTAKVIQVRSIINKLSSLSHLNNTTELSMNPTSPSNPDPPIEPSVTTDSSGDSTIEEVVSDAEI